MCEEEGGTGPDCVRGRAMTDGLIAVMGDWVMGLVSSNGSIPGLVGKISADPISLQKVTSESVDSSCIMAQCLTSGSQELGMLIPRYLDTRVPCGLPGSRDPGPVKPVICPVTAIGTEH